jgi:hypothetical protein
VGSFQRCARRQESRANTQLIGRLQHFVCRDAVLSLCLVYAKCTAQHRHLHRNGAGIRCLDSGHCEFVDEFGQSAVPLQPTHAPARFGAIHCRFALDGGLLVEDQKLSR